MYLQLPYFLEFKEFVKNFFVEQLDFLFEIVAYCINGVIGKL